MEVKPNFRVNAAPSQLAARPKIFVSNAKKMKKCNKKTNPFVEKISEFSRLSVQETIDTKNETDFNNQLNAEFYKTLHHNGIVVYMPYPCQLKICGYVKLTILHGSVNVFGFNLTTNGVSGVRSINLYSPPTFKSYVIETNQPFMSNKSTLEGTLMDGVVVEDAEQLLSKIKDGDAVILLNELILPSIFHAKQYISSYIPNYASLKSGFTLKDGYGVNCSIDNVLSSKYQTFITSPQWNELQVGIRTVITGGSNVGKSTLSRFVIHRLLNSYESILYMECDLGQPEFTPPGSLAVVLLDKPNFGPNFTSSGSIKRMIHLGEVDSSRCVEKYLSAVQNLAQFAETEYKDLPCIINTMGFARGIGVDITKKLISFLNPSHVLEILSGEKRRNFPQRLKPKLIARVSGNRNIAYKYCTVDSIVENVHQSKSGLSNKRARDMMMFSYFSHLLTSPFYSFNAVQPYCVSFSLLTIGLSGCINPNEILKALNCSLIALCEMQFDAENYYYQVINAEDQDSWFRILFDPPTVPSVGLGIVRGIDVARKELYIITPVTITELEKVNLLTLSAVSLPEEIFLQQEGVDGDVPYLTKNEDHLALTCLSRNYRHARAAL